ncbi:hypothetical protein ASZ90_007403 [hydrocarbon metagenome]|uniref:Uncharacterized protein n=1 Tax=hydrocarbon metagenome TaxID=938273 RepID=A0A0W8FPW5_9ZZZZ
MNGEKKTPPPSLRDTPASGGQKISDKDYALRSTHLKNKAGLMFVLNEAGCSVSIAQTKQFN